MKITITIIAVLLGLLSIAAGGAKIALVPEELKFLSQFGFTNTLTIVYGIIQVLAGILLLIPKTRLYASIIAVLAFGLSVVLLFMAGNLPFAGISLIPVVLAGLVAYFSKKNK